MKTFATAMLFTAAVMLAPVFAQDRNDAPKTQTRHVVPARHRTLRHRVTYRRTYQTDQEEHQVTEDLNRQYRGVPRSDVH